MRLEYKVAGNARLVKQLRGNRIMRIINRAEWARPAPPEDLALGCAGGIVAGSGAIARPDHLDGRVRVRPGADQRA